MLDGAFLDILSEIYCAEKLVSSFCSFFSKQKGEICIENSFEKGCSFSLKKGGERCIDI